MDYHPRFLAFAASQGATPQEASERGRPLKGRPYVIWIGERWTEWRKLRGRSAYSHLTAADHADFDAWLADNFPVTK